MLHSAVFDSDAKGTAAVFFLIVPYRVVLDYKHRSLELRLLAPCFRSVTQLHRSLIFLCWCLGQCRCSSRFQLELFCGHTL